jgi:hypothetical protein
MFKKEFLQQRQRDQRKSPFANSKNTIVIRINEVLIFDKNTLNTFADEIVRQFYELTSIKIALSNKLDYDIKTRTLNIL